MKKVLGSRRIAQKIGEDEDSTTSQLDDSDAIKFAKRNSTKGRQSTSLRSSLAQGNTSDEEATASDLITPRRAGLSKIAIQRNAKLRHAAANVPFRRDEDTTSCYDQSTLDQLRQATPSTPRNETDIEQGTEHNSQALDLAAKFGSAVARHNIFTAIPTDAEIREKKERRARLAKEQDFISLDQGDEDLDENVTRDADGRLVLLEKPKYAETRLVRDDEDVFENFDDFTTDGKVGIDRIARKEAERKRRAEMAELIANAEGQSSDDSDDSEEDMNAAFEIKQTQSGNYINHAEQQADLSRPQTPPKITPIPTFESVVSRLNIRLQEMIVAQSLKEKELQALEIERTHIVSEEARIQAALTDTAEKYRTLRQSNSLAEDSRIPLIASEENMHNEITHSNGV